MRHAHHHSPANKACTGPCPGISSAGSSSASGSSAKRRSCSLGCGICRPDSSIRSPPWSNRSRSIVRGPKRGPSPRTRPSRRSIPSSRASSSRALSEVRSSAAPFRKRGWSSKPTGSVSRRVETATSSTPSSAASSSSARSICARGCSRFAPSPTKLLVMAAIVRHPARAAATLSRAVRRIVLTGVVALCCCSAAQAAVLAHPGVPVTAGPRVFEQLQAYPRTLVELDRVRGAQASAELRRAGGTLIEPSLELWRLPSWNAQRLLPGLERRGLVRTVTPDVPLGTDPGHASGFLGQFVDPLSPYEWWPSHIGVTDWVAPGAGFPVTMIDSGVALSHEEFLGRPNTIPLNTQTFPANDEELHGTATASVVGAPVNGKGIVGIYPQAKLQLWDASPDGQLTVGDEIAGLAAARRHGPGVINLSLGGFDRLPIEEHAILNAFGAGQLVVASAGNDREQGSDLSYPASFAHVLTIGATDESDRVTVFLSASPDMDLAAPGQDIEAAIPTLFDPDGYASVDGTSFSAPLVSGAAAAVWTLRPTLTNTQLFEVMRRSARDVGKAGWDVDTGYGILDVPSALTRKPPTADPLEPNEDVYLVRPNGLTRAGKTPLTAQHRPRATIAASLERREDPEDVYRVYLPAKGKIVVTVRPNANVDLELWGKRTTTVFEHGTLAKRDLLGASAHAGAKFERITLKGRGAGQFVYADVFLPKNGVQAAYKLSVAPAAR